MTVSAKHIVVLRIVFALLVAAYFCNYLFGCRHGIIADTVKTLPVLFLSIAAWSAGGFRPHLLPAAFFFSAIGDLFGERGMFIMQIAMFAVAHILYISFFLRRAHADRAALSSVALLAIASVLLGTYIVSRIGDSVERLFCGIYILIISAMTASTLLQRCAHKWLYVVAALIFMMSDGCIAWNRFVGHIPYAGIIIMATYFVAQYIFARLYIGEQTAKAS